MGLNKVSNTIRALAVLIAIFPAAAVIFGLVDIPPTLIQLVKIISFSVSLIVLLAVFLLRSWILKLPNSRAALLGCLAVLLGAISLTTYYDFANDHTVVIPENDEANRYFIIPLRPSEGIVNRVRPFSEDYEEALRMSTQRDTLAALMERERGSALAIMILLLVLSQVLLIAPVVAAVWKLAGAPDMIAGDDAPKPAGGTPPAPGPAPPPPPGPAPPAP